MIFGLKAVLTCVVMSLGMFVHHAANASVSTTDMGYTVENYRLSIEQPGTWTLTNGNAIALVGLSDTLGIQIVTDQDILDHIVNGQDAVVALYNGVHTLGHNLKYLGQDITTLADIQGYESLAYFNARLIYHTGDNLPFSNGLDIFTGLTVDGSATRYAGAFFIEFDPTTDLIFQGEQGEQATLSANGVLGAFPEFEVIAVTQVTPLPDAYSMPEPTTAVILLFASAGGLVLRRRHVERTI